MRKYALSLLFGVTIFSAAAVIPGRATAQTLAFFSGFEKDTSGWSNFGNGSVLRVPSGYSNAGGYADRISSASGGSHARLLVDPFQNFGEGDTGRCTPGAGDCVGPFTDWKIDGNASRFPDGGDRTAISIYLDTGFAASHPDYRFDWDSAMNDSTGQFLQDFVLNVGTGTGQAGDPCGSANTGHFVVSASTSAGRAGSSPENPARSSKCIATAGWYVFQHVFRPDSAGNLAIEMSVLDSQGKTVASWDLHPTCSIPQSIGLCTDGQPLPVSAVGGNAYGWFPNQEIDELAIDDAMLRPLEPQSKADCRDDGWKNFSSPAFHTRADCASFVASRD